MNSALYIFIGTKAIQIFFHGNLNLKIAKQLK